MTPELSMCPCFRHEEFKLTDSVSKVRMLHSLPRDSQNLGFRVYTLKATAWKMSAEVTPEPSMCPCFRHEEFKLPDSVSKVRISYS